MACKCGKCRKCFIQQIEEAKKKMELHLKEIQKRKKEDNKNNK